MLARLESLRLALLPLLLPVVLLWTPALGATTGAVVVALWACGSLFLAARWTLADLDRGRDPRLGLVRDRFSVDRDLIETAAPLLGGLSVAFLVALLFLHTPLALFSLLVGVAGLWNAGLDPDRRYLLTEFVVPVALVIGPALVLRAPAWGDQGDPGAAISPAAHAVSWLAGVSLLTVILTAMTRDRSADRSAGIVTTASKLSRPGAVVLVTAWCLAITLLAGIGVAWWGAAPIVLAGWTATFVVGLLLVRWDGWAVGAGAVGYGLVIVVAAAAAAV